MPSLAQGTAANSVSIKVGAELPRPGDVVEIRGTIASRCQPGTVEVGLDAAPFEEWGALRPTSEDPRSGDELVLRRLDEAAGSDFSFEVELPDVGTDEPILYVICEYPDADGVPHYDAAFQGQPLGSSSPTPSPTSTPSTSELRAVSDVYEGPAGKPLVVASPGVLGNDTPAGGLRAVHLAHVSSLAGQLSFRPNGSLEVRPAADDASGTVCVEYLARNAAGQESNIATVVIAIGDDQDPDQALTADQRCDGALHVDRNVYEFSVENVETEFPLDGSEPASEASAAGLLLAAPADPGLELAQGYRLEAGTYRNHRYCNKTVAGTVVSTYYGSMTGYIWATKGMPDVDYVRMRVSWYQSGTLMKTSGWTKKTFPRGSQLRSYVTGTVHTKFGVPAEVYTAKWQVQWVDDRAGWWRDQIRGTSRWYSIGFSCTSGPW